MSSSCSFKVEGEYTSCTTKDNLKMFQVNDEVVNRVIKTINYSSLKSVNEDIKQIQEWMEKQPHFPEIMDSRRIQNFLILNKGSVERSKEKIENYYCVRSQLCEIFDNVNPNLSYMQSTLDTFYLVPLPRLTKEMYRAFAFQIRDTNLKEKFNPIYGIRYLLNLQEVRLLDDVTYGDVFVLDGKDTPLNFVINMTPTIIYTALIVLYKRVYSNRVKAIYIVNAPPFTEALLNMIKLLVGPKIFERIHFCRNYKVLVEQIGKEILPVDFGGEEESLAELQKMVVKKFEEHQEYFNGLDKLRVNEDLKPAKLENDEMLGFYGNFKKLEVD